MKRSNFEKVGAGSDPVESGKRKTESNTRRLSSIYEFYNFFMCTGLLFHRVQLTI